MSILPAWIYDTPLSARKYPSIRCIFTLAKFLRAFARKFYSCKFHRGKELYETSGVNLLVHREFNSYFYARTFTGYFLYLIYARKIYLRAHVKIERQ